MRMRLYEERFCFAVTAVFACASLNLYAAGGTWQGTTNSDWNVATNWQGGVIPGQTMDTTNRDAVNFYRGSGYQAIVTPDPGRAISYINFDQTAGSAISYTIGTTTGTPLILTSGAGGTMTINATLTNANITETINAPLIIYGDYQFINGSPATSTTLRLGGTISSGTNITINLQFKGSNIGSNTISGVISNGAGTVNVTQIRAGTLLLAATNTYTGSTSVTLGSLIAAADAPSGAPGAFGNSINAVTVGDTASTATGNAALLAGYGNAAVTVSRAITVQAPGGTATQTVTLGSANTSGASQFRGNITLNRPVTLQAAAGGSVDFNTGTWSLTKGYAITVGTPGNTGLVGVDNALNSTGGVALAYGTLAINSNLTSFVTVASNTILTGTGRIVTNGSTTAISIATGGTLDPGTTGGIGTLSVTGNVVFASGGQFRVQASGSTADLLTVTGNVTVPSGSASVLATASGQGPWRIMRATSVDASFTAATPGFTVSRRNGNTELWLGRVGGVIFMR